VGAVRRKIEETRCQGIEQNNTFLLNCLAGDEGWGWVRGERDLWKGGESFEKGGGGRTDRLLERLKKSNV